LKGKNYWLLGTGITIFLVGSYMFVNWMLDLCILVCQQNILEPGNFTFEALVEALPGFYTCPNYWFSDPPCISDIFLGDTVTLMHGLMWTVWLSGILLIIYSTRRIVATREQLSGEQHVND
jgi:hypothetical protein